MPSVNQIIKRNLKDSSSVDKTCASLQVNLSYSSTIFYSNLSAFANWMSVWMVDVLGVIFKYLLKICGVKLTEQNTFPLK